MGYATDWTISDLTYTKAPDVCAANNGVMYVASRFDSGGITGFLAKSTDYGHTWTNVHDDAGRFEKIACSNDGQYVYCAAYIDAIPADRLYRSSDSGATWTITDPGVSGSVSLCCSSSGQYVYFATGSNLYKSTDYGATFAVIYSDLVDQGIRDICCSSDGSVICMTNDAIASPGNGSGIIFTNYGASSSTISDLGLGSSNYLPCAISGDGQKIIISNLYYVVQITTNQGAAWAEYTPANEVNDISCSSDFTKIVIGCYDGNIIASTNSGNTWQNYTDPAADGIIYNIAQTPNGSDLILGIDEGAVYYSTTFLVDSITPATGSTTGGTPVTIVGEGFDPAATAAIDGNDLTDITVVDSTTITGITPAGTAGAVDVVVTNP